MLKKVCAHVSEAPPAELRYMSTAPTGEGERGGLGSARSITFSSFVLWYNAISGHGHKRQDAVKSMEGTCQMDGVGGEKGQGPSWAGQQLAADAPGGTPEWSSSQLAS